MSGTIRDRNNKNVASGGSDNLSDSPSGEVEAYGQEVLSALLNEGLTPTPNNYALYFDRLLEEKSENLRKQIISMLELEESNDAENTLQLEKSLKQGFSSVKNILSTTAHLYKNMALMGKILEKRKKELVSTGDASRIVTAIDNDITKLNAIVVFK